jgi:hypothetical protein
MKLACQGLPGPLQTSELRKEKNADSSVNTTGMD